jgi:hypothetical protein
MIAKTVESIKAKTITQWKIKKVSKTKKGVKSRNLKSRDSTLATNGGR